ncbi:MAG: PEP-CTERM sorting domain-containing protein [Pirellulaceae bacterium]|nr:PEP-CTERM sorting domain-containing protein [Pirellulaceae bacterium]
MRRSHKLLTVAAILAGIGGTASASSTFLFNPAGTGVGGSVQVNSIDPAPGNALAVNGSTAVANCLFAAGFTAGVSGTGNYSCGNGFATQFVYQANLGSMLFTDAGGNTTTAFSQGAGSRFFTLVSSVTEVVTSVDVSSIDATTGLPNIAKASFSLAANQSANFFRMYFSGAAGGNDLTGANFAPATAGNPILAGFATTSSSESTSTSTCAFANPATCSDLDNFVGDSWNSLNTVVNNGSTQITFSITAANAGYFPDLPIGSLIVFDVNTSQVLPFNQANPSCNLIDPTTGADAAYALGTIAAGPPINCTSNGRLGSINGFLDVANYQAGGTQDFLFQADANASLDFQRRVPEPGTLALLAGGLMGAGLWGRRGSKAK